MVIGAGSAHGRAGVSSLAREWIRALLPNVLSPCSDREKNGARQQAQRSTRAHGGSPNHEVADLGTMILSRDLSGHVLLAAETPDVLKHSGRLSKVDNTAMVSRFAFCAPRLGKCVSNESGSARRIAAIRLGLAIRTSSRKRSP